MMTAFLAIFVALLPAYLLRFSIPIPGLTGGLPSTLLEVLFWLLFITWLFKDGHKPGSWRAFDNWALPLTLFSIGGVIGVLVSPDLRGALGLWRAYFLEPVLFFPMFVDIVTRERRGWWVLTALGAMCALIGLTALYQKYTGYGIPNPIWQAALTRRVTSFFGFPNAIGLLCAPIVVLMTGWTISLFDSSFGTRSTRPWQARAWAMLAFMSAILGAAGIIFAVSEGAIVGTAVGIIVLGLCNRRSSAFTLAVIIAACVTVMFYAPANQYFTDIVGFRDDSSSVRAIIWSETAAMLADSPVFGAGLSGYTYRIEPYHLARHIEIFQYPHQLVLNFLSETGIIGLIAFLWIIGRFFAWSWKLRHRGWIVAANASAMVTLLVHGLVDVPYFKNDLAFLFWILIGIIESVRQLSEIQLAESEAAALIHEKGESADSYPSPWLT